MQLSKYLPSFLQLDFAFLDLQQQPKKKNLQSQSEKVHFSLDLMPSRTQHFHSDPHPKNRISYKKIQFLFQDAGNGADPGLTSVCRSHHFRPSSTFLPILGGQSLESIPIVSRAGFGIAPFPLSLRTTFETQ